MRETGNQPDIFWKLAPGGHCVPFHHVSERPELTPELQKYLHILGPTPKRCLEMFADLGLSDDEIGRYFRMPGNRVTELRDVWKIGTST